MRLVVAAIGAYLLGSLSFTRLVTSRLARDVDLSQVKVVDPETGRTYRRPVNATTASMALGWQAGCLIGILDMAKALGPILVLRCVYPNDHLHLVAAVFVVAGNNWPVYYGFRGGSGLSAIYGGLLVIDPLGLAVAVSTGLLVGLIVLRSMLVTFILPLLLLWPWFWYRTGDIWYVAYAAAVSVLYLITMAQDIREYLPKDNETVISERAIMEQMPMGRGMLKILDKLGLKKER